jgi:hypothetical protein
VAQLAAPEQAKIERELDRAFRAWQRLPEVEAAFGAWAEDVVLDFVFEWTLEEDRLHRLAAHAAQGDLTGQQQKRYRQLVALVERHRPIVERLIFT